jgi:hypothetical protein
MFWRRVLGLSPVLVAILSFGCEGGKRELAFPSFDGASVFAVTRESAATAEKGLSEYERALRAAEARAGADTATRPDPVHVVGRYSSSWPGPMRGWTSARDETAAMFVHTDDRGTVDAWIYAEAFSPAVSSVPSLELGRFVATSAPELLGITGPGEGLLEWALSNPTALEAKLGLSVATMLASRTLATGLAFTVQPSSFTGWKWVGRNNHGVELRLGKAEGRGGTVTLSTVVVETVRANPQFPEAVARTVEVFTQRGAAGSSPPGAGTITLGNASLTEVDGIHLAAVCIGIPCPVAADLAWFLDEMKVDPTGQVAGETSSAELGTLASKAGILLVPAVAIEALRATGGSPMVAPSAAGDYP